MHDLIVFPSNIHQSGTSMRLFFTFHDDNDGDDDDSDDDDDDDDTDDSDDDVDDDGYICAN